MHGAAGRFTLVGWDYDSYVPIVHGALENLHFLIAASKRGPDETLFRATPRAGGDRLVEIEVIRRDGTIEVRVLVVALALAPSEPHRFLIQDPAFATVGGDGRSRHLLRRLLASMRRDAGHPRIDPGATVVSKHGAVHERAHAHGGAFLHFEPSRVTWFLGALVGFGGVSYLLFYAPDGGYQDSALMIGSLAFGAVPLVGGIWGRSGMRGALAGSLPVLAATSLYALSISGLLWPNLTATEALAAIVPRALFQGVWKYALPGAFAAAGFVAGGIGGLLGGVVLPLQRANVARTAET